MGRLRVLHVTPYYQQAWAYGGIPRVVAAQVKGLASHGVEVTVATTDACDQVSRLAAASPTASAVGPEVVVFRNLSNTLAYRLQLFLPRGLGAFLKAHGRDFELAHLHGCHNLPGAMAARHLGRFGVPYVVQPNGTAPRIERRRAAKWLFDSTLGRRTLPGAARVLAVSEVERRQLGALGVDSRAIAVIPNPLDLDELAQPPAAGAFRQRLGLGGQPIVMYLGQLGPRKRVDLMLRAVAELDRPDPVVVVAGSDMGSGRRLRRLAGALGLAPRTLFPGVLRGSQRLEALADADVVVYPSEDEIFGLVPVEAILCGTPVVVSDDCGCGEVVAALGGGLVTASGEVAAIAAAIHDMLGDPGTWRQRVAEAAARARRRFAAGAVAAQLVELYRAVAGAADDATRGATP